MFINPFENRNFSARFATVFSFTKQNFFSVLKFYLPVFLLSSGLMYLLSVFSPNSNMTGVLMFVNCAYMALYIKHNGVAGVFSFKECYSTLGRSFLISIEAGICVIIYFVIPVFLILLILISIKLPLVLFLILLVCILFAFFILSQLYCVHYYFSYREYKRSFALLKEVFYMLKGSWLSTLLYMFIFDALLIAVSIPFVIADKFIGYNVFTFLLTPLLTFFNRCL